MRYLLKTDIASTVSNGRSIEQLLPGLIDGAVNIVRFIRIDAERSGGVSATLFEVIDEGNKNFLDVYEFSSVDPDNPYGIKRHFNSFQEAIDFVCENYGASKDKFVNAGVIQSEYEDNYHQNV